jgi:hypothetical protein
MLARKLDMSKETPKSLSAALVERIPPGACLDHCMRGVKYAAGLQRLGSQIRVQIVQAVVDGLDGEETRRILHCWVEVEEGESRMVVDATAEQQLTEVGEYYQNRKPVEIRRYAPDQMHDLLTKAKRAEWFGWTLAEVARLTSTPTISPPTGLAAAPETNEATSSGNGVANDEST